MERDYLFTADIGKNVIVITCISDVVGTVKETTSTTLHKQISLADYLLRHGSLSLSQKGGHSEMYLKKNGRKNTFVVLISSIIKS